MSSTMFKVAVRVVLFDLTGKTPHEVLPTYRRLLGEPSSVHVVDKEVRGFEYPADTLQYQTGARRNNITNPKDFLRPITDGHMWGLGSILIGSIKDFLRPITDGHMWGLEVILALKSSDWDTVQGWSPGVFEGVPIRLESVKRVLRRMGLPETSDNEAAYSVHAYTWDTSGDEPVCFE